MENELIRKISIAIADVNDAYDAIADKGGEVPETSQKTTMHLVSSIQTIPESGGDIEPLNDSFNVNKTSSTYSNTPAGNIGYAPIQINANVLTTRMTSEIDFDSLDFTESYVITAEDPEKYYSDVSIIITSQFNPQLEFDDGYSIPFGFNCDSYNVHFSVDDGNADLYTVLCILSNLNPKIHSYIPDIVGGENNGISFKIIDYNISKGYPEVIKSLHKYVPFANLKNIGDYNDLCANVATMFSECIMYDENDQAIGKASTIKGINCISHIRICTDINIYMPHFNAIGSESLFKNYAELTTSQRQAMMARYVTLKNTFPQEKFISQNMNDIISEVPVRYAKGFNPER